MIASIRKRGPKYIAVGIFFAIISNFFLIGLDALGFAYWLAITSCAAFCIPVAYLAQSSFTFEAPLSWGGFVYYSAAQLFNIPLSLMVIYVLHDRLNMAMFLAAPISTGLSFLSNYAAGHLILRQE
ncbi:hypothetical protein C1T17_08380 [Sphingobium sp. SCG-1]|uniref:GtrA family protein n=1 Tax=Sphingobium sp. SCG-1 TaxID=2072936 RepID=UPI000CD68733|nr:GtrA family protein [Sphingobium sp. SCG-1]AUW58123.1 hypothetical protein C1T17_08380 [Sphingobium sp. SCG-1]